MNSTRDKVEEWIERAHSLAQQKGWWDDGERDPEELCALLLSEVSEALEARRKPESDAVCDKCEDVHWSARRDCAKCGGTGEALTGSRYREEIADVLIRLFDLAGFYRLPFGDLVDSAAIIVGERVRLQPVNSEAGWLFRLSRQIVTLGTVLDSERSGGGARSTEAAALVFAWSLRALGATESELWEAVEAKHRFNLTRPVRHGKRF